MHITEKTLTRILDRLVDRPSWRVVMQSIGASERTAFVWRSKSMAAQTAKDTSSEFFLEWRGAWDYWHNHAGRARLENIMLYESTIRDQAMNGITEVVHGPDQKVLYRERPEYIGRSDDYVELSEGCAPEDVPYYRLERDAEGSPVPLTKTVQIPAPLRLRVLEQDRKYIARSQQDVDVKLQGEIAVAKPLERLPGERRPDLERLKQLAAMTADERRAALGAQGHATDKDGRRIMPPMAPPLARDLADDQGHGLKPAPAPYTPPPTPEPEPEPARPSYTRPTNRLDKGEETGTGHPPPNGFRVA